MLPTPTEEQIDVKFEMLIYSFKKYCHVINSFFDREKPSGLRNWFVVVGFFWHLPIFRKILVRTILIRTILVRTILVRTILVRKILVNPDAFSSNCAQNLCKNQYVHNLKTKTMQINMCTVKIVQNDKLCK